MSDTGPPVDHPIEAADRPAETPERSLDPGLYIVATPIGNLGDLGARAGAVLAAVDAIACEDTRVTGRLLSRLGLKRPMLVYNEHSAPRIRPALLARLRAGERLALVSDAGTPCISDPGHKLVREARAQGTPVRAVPGPSAVMAALSIAGLPTDRFLFLGFLPARTAARSAALAEVADVRATLVLLESAGRLAATLADAVAVLGGEREAAVARELTKLFEEVRRGSLADLAAHYAAATPRGEIVLLIGPGSGEPQVLDPAELDARLLEAAASQPPRRAAAEVARATGLPANGLYARLVALRAGGDADG